MMATVYDIIIIIIIIIIITCTYSVCRLNSYVIFVPFDLALVSIFSCLLLLASYIFSFWTSNPIVILVLTTLYNITFITLFIYSY